MINVEIIIQGWIDEEWGEWLAGLSVSRPEAEKTLLSGLLPDQAALYGVIARMRDLGLVLSLVKAETIETENQNF